MNGVELLDAPAALAELTPAWARLWAASAGASPFQHPSWLGPWWAAFGNARLRLALAGGRTEPHGLLAAYEYADGQGRRLLPVGAGASDYLDALGREAPRLLAALLDRAARDGVGRCDLFDLPPESALREAPAPPGWRVTDEEGEACPVLPLDPALSAVPARAARSLRMNRNRAARAGGARVVAASGANLGPALDALFALHARRWGPEGGIFAAPGMEAFLRLAAPGLLAAGLLRLRLLRLDGEAAAAVFALVAPGRLFFYLGGFDPAQRFVSPGSLLIGAMLEEAAGEGRTEAHFLRGRETYKYGWGAADRLNAVRRFTRA